jgi:cytochrome c oxidase assembly protein subunit 11
MTKDPNNQAETADDKGTSNKVVIRNLLFVVVGMFGFGFALVPLYDVFCDLTGLNGKTGDQYVSDEPVQIDTSRNIEVEFLANLNAGMPWEFEPLNKAVRVHPGEAARIEYVARNNTDKDIVGQAVPSVSPGPAAAYFQKTECFCFTEQVLKAGEEKIMPVIFVVDPAIDEDIKEIALSYTFFIKPGSEDATAKDDVTKRHSIAQSKPLTQY